MVTVALILLLIAVLFGCWLAVLHFDGRPPAAIPGVLVLMHAVPALVGFLLFVISFRGHPSSAGSDGRAVFSTTAMALLAGAVAVGFGLLVRFRIRKKGVEALVGIHATLAVSGIVILAVYVLG